MNILPLFFHRLLKELRLLVLLALLTGLVLSLFQAPVAWAATLTVCASGCDYTSIQAAIDAATAGDTINVAAGTYNEDVNINKANLRLQGAGIDLATIVGPPGGSANTVQFQSTGGIVEGFTITRSGNNLAEWNNANLNNQGVTFNSSGNTVQNCKLTENRTGILLAASGNIVQNNLIDFNRTGIHIINTAGNNQITGNQITHNWTIGVLFRQTTSADGNVLYNNQITGNWYSQVEDRGNPAGLVRDLRSNSFGPGLLTTLQQNTSGEPGYSALIPVQFGGTATPPPTAPTFVVNVQDPNPNGDTGGRGNTNPNRLAYSPWLSSGTDTQPATPGFQGDFLALSVDDAGAEIGGVSYIQAGIDAVNPGGTVRVYPGNYSETASNRTLFDGSGPYQFGLFIGQAKSGITIQGVDNSDTPITNFNNILATVNTNATNNFGPSGIFVEGDHVTIAGLRVGTNSADQNKTIEVLGDNFTLRNTDIADPQGSVYLNDWRFDTGANASHLQSYRLEGNNFQDGVSLDLASGAGFSGPVSGRVITGNHFTNRYSWPSISFSGSDTGVPWFVYSVGGAIIQTNTFTNTASDGQIIRARGTYDNSQFDWASYWNDNSFNKAVIVGLNPPADIRTYSYTSGSYTFNNVRRIGAVIQPEIDHGVSGDTVLVKAGTYIEQVKIGKSLTLVSTAGYTSTTIQAPASIPASSDQESTIVKISGAGVSVEISGFTVAGPGPSGCGSILSGIFVRDGAYADIHHNRILDIRDYPFSGCQNGIGIFVGRASFSTSGTATIANNIIQGYQKNGIVVSNSGSSATITGNTITGIGPTTVIAQNGIQVSSGATGTLSHNTISGHSYTLFTYVSAGILLYGANADASDNELDENQVGIYHIEGSGTHARNLIKATGVGTGSPGFWGIVVDAPPPGHQPNPFEAELDLALAQASLMAAATQAVIIINNDLTGDGANAGIGLEADAGYGALDIDLTASNNFIRNWGTGVLIYKCTSSCTSSVFTNVDVNLNSFTGNLKGLDNSSDFSVDALRNWWGSQTGPTHGSNTGGAGNSVNNNVTFTPWLCDGTDTSTDIGFQPNTTTLCAIPTRLVFTVQPGDSEVNNPLTVQPVVRAEDAFGNLGINFSGAVTLALNPSGATLTGLNPVNPVNGVTTFSGLSVDKAGTYTLNASGLGLSGATSTSFVIDGSSNVDSNNDIFLPIIFKNH